MASLFREGAGRPAAAPATLLLQVVSAAASRLERRAVRGGRINE